MQVSKFFSFQIFIRTFCVFYLNFIVFILKILWICYFNINSIAINLVWLQNLNVLGKLFLFLWDATILLANVRYILEDFNALAVKPDPQTRIYRVQFLVRLTLRLEFELPSNNLLHKNCQKNLQALWSSCKLFNDRKI